MDIHTIVNSIFQSKTYVLSTRNNREAWLVDCGDSQPIIEFITTNKLILKGILITHAHFDHIYGLNGVNDYFPGAKVYTSEEGKKGLYDVIQNLSKYYEAPWTYNYNNVSVLTEQSELFVLDKGVKTFFTPGHDISCLSFKIDKYLFVGDSYIPGLKTFSNWPLSEKQKARVSEERILKIAQNEHLEIRAGH